MLFRSSGCDWMIVGLGNPGKDYEKTRHNVGFRCVDLIAAGLRTKVDRLKFKAMTRLVNHKGMKLLLVQPQMIVTLGNVALKALCGSKAVIGDMHGRTARVTVTHEKQSAEFPLFPLYHPASIIYNRSLQAVYDEDLQVLKLVLG